MGPALRQNKQKEQFFTLPVLTRAAVGCCTACAGVPCIDAGGSACSLAPQLPSLLYHKASTYIRPLPDSLSAAPHFRFRVCLHPNI